MSYNATQPHPGGDRTLAAKGRLIRIFTEEFRKRGYKSMIKTEIPAVIQGKKYHADIGILLRPLVGSLRHDAYQFFIVEIDGQIGHETFRTDKKSKIRDQGFLNTFGIITIRIPLTKIVGKYKIESNTDLFESLVWPEFAEVYVDPRNSVCMELAADNTAFSIQLLDNSQLKCNNCSHPAHLHCLSGCDFVTTNKAKMRCPCRSPYFTSDG